MLDFLQIATRKSKKGVVELYPKFVLKTRSNDLMIRGGDALAEQLANDGWNVKPLTPRDPDEKVNHFIKVKISFKVRPPKIWLLTNHKRTLLDEDTIATLQYARIENADVVVSPWRWEVNGKTGIAAYLETLYVKIEDDPFADKYADYESSDEVPF